MSTIRKTKANIKRIVAIVLSICMLPIINFTDTANASITMESGSYYINNSTTGKYAGRNSSSPVALSGKLSSIKNSVSWYFTKIDSNYFAIKGSSSSQYYLCNSAGSTVSYTSKSTVDDSCKWSATMTSSGVLLKNKATGRYLYSLGAKLYTTVSTSTSNCHWRIILTSRYGNTSSYSYRELGSFSISDFSVGYGQSKTMTINKYPLNGLLWADTDDFTYSSSRSSIAKVSSTGTVKGVGLGEATITVKHKVTGLSDSVKVKIVADSSLMGTKNEGHDHSSALKDAQTSMKDNGYNYNYYSYSAEHSKGEVEKMLKYSRFFISRSHGLDSKTDSGIFYGEEACFYKEYIYNFTSSKVVLDMSYNKICTFVGCFTAYLGDNSIAKAANLAGANASVGFADSIDCEYANKWTCTYASNVASGETVKTSCYNAYHNGWYIVNMACGLGSYKIYGNSNQCL